MTANTKGVQIYDWCYYQQLDAQYCTSVLETHFSSTVSSLCCRLKEHRYSFLPQVGSIRLRQLNQLLI